MIQMDFKEAIKIDDIVNKLKSGVDVLRETATGGYKIVAKGHEAKEDLLSTIFTLHNQGKLTEAILIDLVKKHDIPTLSTPFKTMPPIELNIKLVVDGNQWCALIGENLQVGIAGFGNTRLGALMNLIDNYQKEHPGWVCKDCGEETRTFWPDTHRGDIGRCNICHFKHLLIEFPPPALSDMKNFNANRDENYFEFKVWPHNYIPAECPYCKIDINRCFIGSYNDHVLHEHFCPGCKVYFGQTD